MTLIDRTALARLLGLGVDGPLRPDGSWMPENGRELYFHSHLTEPHPDETTDAKSDRRALKIVCRISELPDDTEAIARVVEEGASHAVPENRYVVEQDGNVRHITLTGERRIIIAPA